MEFIREQVRNFSALQRLLVEVIRKNHLLERVVAFQEVLHQYRLDIVFLRELLSLKILELRIINLEGQVEIVMLDDIYRQTSLAHVLNV